MFRNDFPKTGPRRDIEPPAACVSNMSPRPSSDNPPASITVHSPQAGGRRSGRWRIAGNGVGRGPWDRGRPLDCLDGKETKTSSRRGSSEIVSLQLVFRRQASIGLDYAYSCGSCKGRLVAACAVVSKTRASALCVLPRPQKLTVCMSACSPSSLLSLTMLQGGIFRMPECPIPKYCSPTCPYRSKSLACILSVD